MKHIIIFTTFLFFFLSNAVACPAINGIPDYNCDGMLQITVFGDSLVYGTGDAKYNNKGGYVKRLAKIFPKASVTNLGVAGLNTNQALKILENAFDKDKAKSTKAAFERSDIVILDLGRNDRWFFGPPSIALKNLQKIAAKIKSEVTKSEGIPPLVITAVLMSPNRGAQAPWVKVLDQLILASSKPSAPSDLRFDLANKRLLNKDQIHPTSAGYAQIAQIAASYLKKKVPPLMKKLRPDTDGDGISDIVETAKFGTDPLLVDTDGDGKSDEDEVIRLFSDPLVFD